MFPSWSKYTTNYYSDHGKDGLAGPDCSVDEAQSSQLGVLGFGPLGFYKLSGLFRAEEQSSIAGSATHLCTYIAPARVQQHKPITFKIYRLGSWLWLSPVEG